jgi:Xaa-Pro aminopeptidase
MKEQGMQALLISQDVDLFYFTGSMQTGYLFIPEEGEGIYYVRRSVTRALQESKVRVAPLGSFREFGDQLAADFPAVFAGDTAQLKIGAEFDVVPVQLYQRLAALLPQAVWVDGARLIRETRMIKSAAEVACIREAARVVDIALEEAIVTAEVGMTEIELLASVEATLRRHGHLGLLRVRGYNQTIVTGMLGSGEAAATPSYFDGPAGGQGLSAACPQSAGTKRLRRNEPILFDIGCNIDGYVIDQTRTLVFGELPEPLAGAYAAAEAVLAAAEAALKPGAICEQLYAAALEQVHAAGLSAHFMGYGDDQVKFLGHGIGLEIDELPVLAKGFTYPLEPGMVIAIEPKFTFPGLGVVGVEDTYLITETGYEKLTQSRSGLIRIPR